MSEQTFEDRIAALEEHIVAPPRTTVEEFLARSERALAAGDEEMALAWLRHAKITRSLDWVEAGWEDDEMEAEDDDASGGENG